MLTDEQVRAMAEELYWLIRTGSDAGRTDKQQIDRTAGIIRHHLDAVGEQSIDRHKETAQRHMPVPPSRIPFPRNEKFDGSPSDLDENLVFGPPNCSTCGSHLVHGHHPGCPNRISHTSVSANKLAERVVEMPGRKYAREGWWWRNIRDEIHKLDELRAVEVARVEGLVQPFLDAEHNVACELCAREAAGSTGPKNNVANFEGYTGACLDIAAACRAMKRGGA